MEAIYGKEGVKAGFTTGQCQKDISDAIDGLVAEGVEVIILGCTELPLLLPQTDFTGASGACVKLVERPMCLQDSVSRTQPQRAQRSRRPNPRRSNRPE